MVVAVALGTAAAVLTFAKSKPETSELGRAVTAHLRALTSPDYQTRDDAEAALAAIGPEGAPFLVANLDDRPTALEIALLRVNDRLGLPPFLPSSTPQLRVRAAEQLASVAAEHPLTVPAL